MADYTNIRCKVPKDFDYKLNLRLAELKRMNIKRTKADEIIILAQIGLLNNKIDDGLTQYESYPGKK